MSILSKKSYNWPWAQFSKTNVDNTPSEASSKIEEALPEVSHNVERVLAEVSENVVESPLESPCPVPEPYKQNFETSSKSSGTPETAEIQKKKTPPSHWTWFQMRSTPSEVPSMKISVSSIELSKAPTKEIETVETFCLPKTNRTSTSIWSFWSTDSDPEPMQQTRPALKGKSLEELQDTAKPPSKDNINETRPYEGSRLEVSKSNEDESKTLQSRAADQIERVSQNTTSSKFSTHSSNLILPSLNSTYEVFQTPSPLEKIARLFYFKQKPIISRIFLSNDIPRIKKALAIGIHGLVPAPLLRPITGQPTGTSIRFVNHAAEAIQRWSLKNGLGDCEIEKIALEGQGKIFDRVNILWKYLLNHINHVRTADFVLIACHSQGVPVAIMLVSKLIEFEAISSGRIGVCAMAGVSLGPFSHYKSRLLSGSPAELFDLANSESEISKKYEHSLRIALNYGVRIMFCGSIDDQLVSMESAVFSTANHPYIYRAVFIDGRVHSPNFISHLVGLILKMRNLGASDHGLIRELSGALAGSLYSGDGHSRLYDDQKVYDLAIEFALQTTSVDSVPLEINKKPASLTANPYILPWIMRGLIEEEIVKTKLYHEISELLKLYDTWKPLSKTLKDIKYRLEPLRSKL